MNDLFALDLPSRLVSFDPRRVPLYRFDVLVVGSGAAGASAALAAAEAGAQVAVVAKAGLEESNTLYAQGGVAAVMHPADSFAAHTADTLAVGCGLSEAGIVEHVVRGGPDAMTRLMEWGASFDRCPDGELELSREGGHSHRRVLHARGDATGREIMEAVAAVLHRHPAVTTFPGTFVVDLVRGGSDGDVSGCVAMLERGELVAFSAGHVILATGGAGQVYRETTNPTIATGDGVALGFRAGAVVRDLEFFQFHPTCLYIAGAARVLISEIVRGAGGVLRDRLGKRFMQGSHPDAELAPRDVVSRAVFDRMVETGDTSVYLDLSDVDGDPHERFPGISRICRFFGIDIATDPVPVRPGAHYMIGGLEVDADGRTSVPGLWAVGECASTGLHGANRIGSNSLLEALVLGTRAGERAAAAGGRARSDAVLGSAPDRKAGRTAREREPVPGGIQVNIEDVTYSLKSLMWRQLGVARERRLMEDAHEKIALWTRAITELAPPEPRTWELLNMLTVARLVACGALAREESRGVHFRNDFRDEVDAWRAHTRLEPVIEGDRVTSVRLQRVPVAQAVTA
ncbi:MAG: L-aspartate oxidase [Planctomycetota bacterium]|nr:L-aspartate oxidase [Planctomycetota bacterium]